MASTDQLISVRCRPYRPLRCLMAVSALLALVSLDATAPRFFPDDPIARFPETQDASRVAERPAVQGYDFVESTLLHRGDRTARRALNLSTVDEVPDSSWFTNRIGSHTMTLAELETGPDVGNGPADGLLRIVRGKAAGVSPGFQMRDARGDLYFVKVDPPRFPELASAAEVISTKILYALGYNVPENYILSVARDRLSIEGATVTGRNQQPRAMTRADLDFILNRAARQPDGSYRLLASKALPGRSVGPFRYFGTRPDDPNDLIPHEHRRELRGLRVFAAWLNHADSRGINSLDTLVDQDGLTLVRHHLLDFGSTLGSAGIDQKSRRSGNEYLFDARKSLIRAVTLGVVVPDWTHVPFPRHPGVGRFEAERFVPERWVPHYPNPAFDNAGADDLFWAARRVMAFSDDAIRAMVRQGRLSDADAERYLADTLIARRDKIGRAWLTHINPLIDFTLDADGELRFTNAAVDMGVATPPSAYRVRWSRYDNTTDTATPVGREENGPEPVLRAPRELIEGAADYLKAEIVTVHAEHEAWLRAVDVYFREQGDGWQTVGIWRVPE